MSGDEKLVEWVGRSKAELLDFPRAAIRRAGRELGLVQEGEEPEDWRPMETIGPGACEIRVRTHEGGTVQHRVIYVARFAEAVYVLHAFQKTTRATSQHNIDVARARYAQMLRERDAHGNTRKGGMR
ncbi:type II toxin-antitoxin system RelE/ParE family toxin [Longimicrobium sp.]|uniref:type II toxin-antitoxin system RelE/ParE family toxin n=1 Tax=Longimicrobium sp. TaxID=2029185 RepID=UPI002E3400D6|nr:type II toxin-antitoxin system RelE/ParE family toxin [Longimicrobium sp.]HEX6041970.1 type II toxin-antitoxin system RelE/ParE family toxin [Longimicrobium sp.]